MHVHIHTCIHTYPFVHTCMYAHLSHCLHARTHANLLHTYECLCLWRLLAGALVAPAFDWPIQLAGFSALLTDIELAQLDGNIAANLLSGDDNTHTYKQTYTHIT